jgi:uncharacterized membrane protein YqaE (UPF0057 family)
MVRIMERLVLILLAVFLPPVAVFLVCGFRAAFWLNLLLTLIVFFPGMVHALWVVLTEREKMAGLRRI